ncbi:hypothetical protein [Moritella viscosa]|uniref:hypothetical protein n=1 Tax=Moritella viscosa TaxID=80854 RepID=UPI0009122DDD|nr:hypothetical protein [Moritella viscosa]SGZ08219.1 Molybdate ABC transporter, permease protein [Moritella viscosa]
MLKALLSNLFLNSDARKLGKSLADSNIQGAEVVGRGTIVVDGKVIASSKEFLELKAQARKIVNSRQESQA